jgi:hypothetical protein
VQLTLSVMQLCNFKVFIDEIVGVREALLPNGD